MVHGGSLLTVSLTLAHRRAGPDIPGMCAFAYREASTTADTAFARITVLV
jgi:hypothetical protein